MAGYCMKRSDFLGLPARLGYNSHFYRLHTIMKSIAARLALVFLFSTTYCQLAHAGELLDIEYAWLAEAPPVSKVMAAYMTIENDSQQQRQAVAMVCREFARTEFHRTMEKDGIASMQHQQVLSIPANSKLELKPGGYHVMLFEPARRLLAGDNTGCSMEFDDGTTIGFDLVVKKTSSTDHSHHQHHNNH
jgi:copper(I)-binding protein